LQIETVKEIEIGETANRGVARNLIWVGINCTMSNLSWVKETKQPHKKFKLDWFGGIYTDTDLGVYIPSLRPWRQTFFSSPQTLHPVSATV